MTVTDQKVIAVDEDTLADWVDQIRQAAYLVHERGRHGKYVSLEFCTHEVCRALSAVSIEIEHARFEGPPPESWKPRPLVHEPEPEPVRKPRARRPRKSTAV